LNDTIDHHKQYDDYMDLLIMADKLFCEFMEYAFKIQGIDKVYQFEQKTGLDPHFYRDLRSPGKVYTPRVLVSAFAGLGFSVVLSQKLLEKNCCALYPSRFPDNAYLYLLEYGKGMTFEERNEFLRSKGARRDELLGSLQRK